MTYHAKLTTSVGWNDTQASPRRFCDRRLSSIAAGRALARCWFRREKARVVITGWHARWLVVIVNNGFPVD